jgi:transposase
MFVGWDWASTTHDVTVLDDAGAVVDRWALQHTEQDLAAALGRLARLGEPAALPVTIERSGGLVVERLVAAGHPVVPVHPTAVWAARPRWGASGAKSDAGDSYKLADYLRTDGHRLRRLDSPDAGLQELQALVRLREDHLRARTAASNQLGVLLEAHWPGPKAVFYRLASPIALAFLADYPTPQAAARLGQERMASLLPTAQLPRRQATGGAAGQAALGTDRPGRHPGGHPGDPCPRPSPAAAHPAWDHHRPRGEDRHARRQPPARQAARVAARCRHHQPRPTARRGRADPGPGQQRRAGGRRVRRRAGHQGLRQDQRGLLPLGRQPSSPQGADRLRAQLAAGVALGRPPVRRRPRPRQAQPHATRIVARAWLRVIWACWQHATPYNPAVHTAALPATAPPT